MGKERFKSHSSDEEQGDLYYPAAACYVQSPVQGDNNDYSVPTDLLAEVRKIEG